MSWITKIDETYNQFFKEAFNSFGLLEYYKMDETGMGALKRYSNGKINVQLLNDRGIITFEISEYKNEDEFIEFEILMNHYNANSKSNSQTNRYSYDEQVEFLISNWDLIVRDFSSNNFKKTRNNIYSQ